MTCVALNIDIDCPDPGGKFVCALDGSSAIAKLDARKLAIMQR